MTWNIVSDLYERSSRSHADDHELSLISRKVTSAYSVGRKLVHPESRDSIYVLPYLAASYSG